MKKAYYRDYVLAVHQEIQRMTSVEWRKAMAILGRQYEKLFRR